MLRDEGRLAFARALEFGAIRAYWKQATAEWDRRWPLQRLPRCVKLGEMSEAAESMASKIGKAAAALDTLEAGYIIGLLYTVTMPDRQRAELGACYTPPALCERLLDTAANAGWIGRRPACWTRFAGDEFDFEAAVWTVSEAHMKRYRPHRVPLSTGALAVLKESRNLNGHEEFAFRGPRGGKLDQTAVADALRKAEIEATGHGFRSSFKDWARHEGVDEILSEFALAHVEGSKTVAAYARDDLLEKRRPVMQAWSDFVSGAACG